MKPAYLRRSFRYALMTVLAVVCLSAAALAQRTTGSIEGTVTDSAGAVVPGVTITVTGVSVGFTRTATSDTQGIFRFQQIPIGTYRLTTTATAGFAATVVESVTVTIENITAANIKLGVASTAEAVVVTTDALGINLETSDSKVQTNVTEKLIDQLPKGVGFDSLLRAAAPVRSEPFSGGMQIDGASGSENAFIVDGLSVENFRTGVLNGINNIPTSLVSEVQIKTGGFEAEHGGAAGGVIVVATKSGSDAFHGEIGSEFQPSALQPGPRVAMSRFVSSNADAAAVANNRDYTYLLPQKRDKYLNFFPTASISGPVIKGRLWFLQNYSPQVYRSTRTSTFINAVSNANFASGTFVPSQRLVNGQPQAPLTYKAYTKNEYSFSRLDGQILNTLRGTATFLWNPQTNNGTLPYDSVTTSIPNAIAYNGSNVPNDQYYRLTGGRVNSNQVTGQLTWTPTSRLVGTFRYGRGFLNEKGSNYAIANASKYTCSGVDAAYSTIGTACARGFTNLGSNDLVSYDISIKSQFNWDVTYIPKDFAGRHEFKGGFERGVVSNEVLSGYAGTGRVVLYYGQDYAQAIGGVSLPCTLGSASCIGVGTLTRFGASGVGQNNFKGFYAQDKWQPINRLTLNLGIRLEKEFLPSFNAGDLLAGSAIPGIEIGWGKKIAPRLGGAYDLFGDGKTKIYGSFGWFYDRLRFELPRGSFGGNFYRVDYFPITAAHPEYTYYTPDKILGTFTDPRGGGNPSTAGGLSQLQRDFRIPSNLTRDQFVALGLVPTGVDPDIKAFRQSEFTVGFERELASSYVLSVRFTRKNVDHAIEDHAILGLAEAENYPIGNPGEGFVLALDKQTGYVKSAKPQRLYRALEIVLNKRLGKNYFFNANYTLSSLYGNYSGLASSDEVGAGGTGRLSPAVNRFFDYAINGFTATGDPDNGNLATDRRHAFKAYGGYTFDKWQSKGHSTDFSFFFTGLQGTPQTTFVSVVATSIPLSKRGDLGRTPVLTQTDFALAHHYRVKENKTLSFELNVSNLFNQNTVTRFNTTRYRVSNGIAATDIDPNYDPDTQTLTAVLNQILNGQIGTTLTQLENGTLPSLTTGTNPLSSLYGVASGYQPARSIRFGFRFQF